VVFDVVVVVECFFRQEALFDRRGDHPNATRVAIVRPRAPRVVVVVDDDVFTDDTNDDDVNVNDDDDDVEDAHAHHFDESLFCVVFKTRPDVDGRASSRPTDDVNDDVVFVRGGGIFGSLPVVVVVVTSISSSSSSSSSSLLLLLLSSPVHYHPQRYRCYSHGHRDE